MKKNVEIPSSSSYIPVNGHAYAGVNSLPFHSVGRSVRVRVEPSEQRESED